MKIAKIVPIYKAGNVHDINNYRPISLLPSFSKLMEKILCKKLVNFFDNSSIFYKHQYGFRKGHSTIHPIIHLIKSITESNDKKTKDKTLGIFLDLSKAFDSVSHTILLKKLEFYGVRGVILEWFKNYLTTRQHFTEINGIKSSLKATKCGVPQGSILGPLLYLIYVNDIENATSLNILSFADDTTLFKSASNIPELVRDVNIQLQNLSTWFNANKLCLNVSKSNFMLFFPQNHFENRLYNNLNISINNIQLNQISSWTNKNTIKFLGLQLDQHLTWNPHICALSNKVSNQLFMLNKVKKSIATGNS